MSSIFATDVTTMSSKGQIVLPKSIRTEMELESGMTFIVLSDGSNILLKPIVEPNLEEFSALAQKAQAWAQDVGMTAGSIDDAIKQVRHNKSRNCRGV